MIFENVAPESKDDQRNAKTRSESLSTQAFYSSTDKRLHEDEEELAEYYGPAGIFES